MVQRVAERGHEPADSPALDAIAMFRPELVDEAPAAVLALRRAFAEADGIVFAVPEYGGGMAGWAKNALDWMVGAGTLYGRPVAVLSAGTTGGAHAIGQLARTLTWQGAFVVATLGIASPRTKADAEGHITDAATTAAIAVAVDRLLEAVDEDDVRRAARAATTVGPLGIDVFDRRPAEAGDGR